MNGPLPPWVGAVIAVGSFAVLIGVIVITRRLDRRRRARLAEQAIREFVSARSGPLDDRQKELLQHGILPWYEFPNLWTEQLPSEQGDCGRDGPPNEGGPE